MVRDARMHKTGGYMDRETETSKSASAFKPAGYIIRESDFFFRDPQNHLTRLYNDITTVFHMNPFGYVLKMGIVLHVIDFCLLFESSEIIAQSKIN
jgi:hypothetical protein